MLAINDTTKHARRNVALSRSIVCLKNHFRILQMSHEKYTIVSSII